MPQINETTHLEEKDIYDLNGNMTYDATAGLMMEWNDLNLIKKVSDGNGMLINYSYLADSTKVRAVDADGEVHKHFKRLCAY